MALTGVLRPGHVALRVLDMEASVHHYVNVMGLLETARDAQGRKVGSAQGGRGLSAQGGGHEAADDVGQGLQFAGLVHGGGGLGGYAHYL